jgi:hypothetical protein
VPSKPATTVAAIGSRDAFCAAAREGCTRTCVAPPTAWAGATPTFAHAELWAYQDQCPDEALHQLVRCTLAIEHAGVWYEAFDTVCKNPAGPSSTTGLTLSRVRSHSGLDAFDYQITGTLLASDERNGARADSTLDVLRRYVTVCGVGPSHVPSCFGPIDVGGNGMGDPYAERSWELGDRGLVTLGAFPAGSEPDSSTDDGGASRFRIALP